MNILEGIDAKTFDSIILNALDEPIYVDGRYISPNKEGFSTLDLTFIASIPDIKDINNKIKDNVVKDEIRSLYLMLLNSSRFIKNESDTSNSDNVDQKFDLIIDLNASLYLHPMTLLKLEIIIGYLEAQGQNYLLLDNILKLISHVGVGHSRAIRGGVADYIGENFKKLSKDTISRMFPKNLKQYPSIESEPLYFKYLNKMHPTTKIKYILALSEALLYFEETKYIFLEGLFGFCLKNVAPVREIVNLCTRGLKQKAQGALLREFINETNNYFNEDGYLNVGKWHDFLKSTICLLESVGNLHEFSTRDHLIYTKKYNKEGVLMNEVLKDVLEALIETHLNSSSMLSNMTTSIIKNSIEFNSIMKRAKTMIEESLYVDYAELFANEKKRKETEALSKLIKAKQSGRK